MWGAPVLVLPGLREALSAGQCLLLIVGGAFVSTQTLLVSKRQPAAVILPDGPGFGELGTCLRISNKYFLA